MPLAVAVGLHEEGSQHLEGLHRPVQKRVAHHSEKSVIPPNWMGMGTEVEIPPSRDDEYMIWEVKNLALNTKQLSKTEITAHTGDLSSHQFPFPKKSAENLTQSQTCSSVLDALWCPLDGHTA